MRAPDFWEHGFGTGPALLSPLSLVYRGGGLMRRALVRPWRAPVPVICVGGLVVGGSGKTPVALALGALLQRWGRKVHFLARGYGGKLGRRRSGPARVDPERHGVAEVGDEALLLAAQAPTWVARDRRAGARAAVDAGADILVMDDGLQYPGLIKDLSLIVVDGTYGFGNRRVIPSGPLREPIRQGLKRADVLVLVGENISGVTATIPISMPLLRARLVPGPEAADLATGSVVAFAGIGHPEKFFRTLEEVGCEIRARHAFPDHHVYSADEVAAICEEAEGLQAVPVTTAKDAVRLPEGARGTVRVLTVTFRCNDERALEELLGPVLGDG
jgi:tetraacyldisaccharide 4'-kinase